MKILENIAQILQILTFLIMVFTAIMIFHTTGDVVINGSSSNVNGVKDTIIYGTKSCNYSLVIGLKEYPLKLIGAYDIDKDGDQDCIYRDSSDGRIYLYETYDNGHGNSLAGEFVKQH